MNHIDYFKRQAKNLFKDYKTQFVDESGSVSIYGYKPKYFDINGIFMDYGWNEENLTLMKIQHIFAVLVGFESWAELINSSEAELELAKLLFDNQHKISLDGWQMYIAGEERDNNTTFDTKSRIEIFKAAFANVEGHHNTFGDYRLHKKPDSGREIKRPQPAIKANPDGISSRSVTYLKGITTLHYTKRDIEKFDVGDEAWISWDGKKALPVIITEVDDRHYSVKIERPLKQAGNVHSLFLDEVRSTPEAACQNCVTL
ncbi:MAG: hypothetical protein DI582_10490 [Azospirillum brasilense]|nr:MAG: hypothetical protein DI582_10490 [Azospirillum brasilense]